MKIVFKPTSLRFKAVLLVREMSRHETLGFEGSPTQEYVRAKTGNAGMCRFWVALGVRMQES